MKYDVSTIAEYFEALPEDRKKAMNELRKVIRKNLPKGFKEVLTYGMPGYVVPHSLYPKGYHVNPTEPLPFICIASQKNFIALYHMGIYANRELLKWFSTEYPKHCKSKLDMGKSCIRFKKTGDIPYKLIGELASKISPSDWVKIVEQQLSKAKK